MVNEATVIQQQWERQKKPFFEMWSQASTQADEAYMESVWERISSGYCETHRHYHSPRHILFCLSQYELVVNSLTDRIAVGLALWFHDLILDPAAKDNEERSMYLFQELSRNHLPEPLIEKISSLIMITRHIDVPGDNDESFIQDIDLSSMGEVWNSFVRDVEDLRKESPHLSDKQFIEITNNFYLNMLGRERIYSSEYFHERCEQQARDNIRRYMKEIPGYSHK